MQKSEIWLRALGQKNQGMNSVDMHVPTVNESDSTELSERSKANQNHGDIHRGRWLVPSYARTSVTSVYRDGPFLLIRWGVAQHRCGTSMENQWKNQWKNHHICRTLMEKLKNHGKNGKSSMENLWKIGKPMEIRMELEWKINGTSTIFVDFLFGKDWFSTRLFTLDPRVPVSMSLALLYF